MKRVHERLADRRQIVADEIKCRVGKESRFENSPTICRIEFGYFCRRESWNVWRRTKPLHDTREPTRFAFLNRNWGLVNRRSHLIPNGSSRRQEAPYFCSSS